MKKIEENAGKNITEKNGTPLHQGPCHEICWPFFFLHKYNPPGVNKLNVFFQKFSFRGDTHDYREWSTFKINLAVNNDQFDRGEIQRNFEPEILSPDHYR